MAYYDDGYMWPQEHATSDLVCYHDSVSFSGSKSFHLDTYDTYTVSEFQEPQFFDHYHHAQGYDYGYDHNSVSSVSPGINYFAYNYVEPNLIAYEPVSCDTGYVSYHTHYSSSYVDTDLRFNEPEFDEYDPTPYDGGYDIVSVYGKPLPPSDKTCYPRSNPKPAEPEPEPKSKPVATPIPLVNPKPEPQHEPGSKPESEPVLVPVLMPPPSVEPEPEPEPVKVRVPKEECSYPDHGFDYPWPEYDHGYGIGVGYDYGYGNQVVQVPPLEYNPEVVDLCENIFGSWPCLTRIRKQQMEVDNNAGITCPETDLNPWVKCASYIFGRPIESYNG